MLNVPAELCNRIAKIESNYNISCVLFSKYKIIFNHLFDCSSSISSIHARAGRSNKACSLNTQDLFNFGWLFYIYIKHKFPHIINDLVNSYHLLICCINLIYLNLNWSLLSKSNTAYLNKLLLVKLDDENQSELLVDESSDLFSLNYFIDYVCKKFDGNTIEVKTINEHYFKPQIKQLLAQSVLNKDSNKNLFYLDDLNEFKNLHLNLNSTYESLLNKNNDVTTKKLNIFISMCIDYDERLFINANQNSDDNEDGAENEMMDVETVNGSNKFKDLYKLVVPSCLYSILNPSEDETLDKLLEKLKQNEGLKELDNIDFDLVEVIQDFLINKSFNAIRNSILNELKLVSIDSFLH